MGWFLVTLLFQMSSSLKSKTFRALSWSFLESAGLQGVRFVIGLVLARLLFPEEFGLIGMLMIFIAVSQSFLDGGFGTALIQKREPTPTDVCSIFYFNLVVGAGVTGLLCLAAPWIAAFYEQPILAPLTRALSLLISINAFGLIQTTLLTKAADFKTQTKASLISAVLSGVLGIGLAMGGYGVWSLAVQQIIGALLRTVLLWRFSSWRPAFLFSFGALRTMFGFGSRMLCSNVLNQIFENIYLVVIGKLFSAGDLGMFTRAKTFQELPSGLMATVVGRVTFPVFAGIQEDRARIKRGLRTALTFLVLLNFPLMIGMAVTARPMVLVLLTEKWLPAVPYLQWLCLVGLLFPLHVMNLNVLTALGRSDLFLRLEIIKKVLIVLSIAVTWSYGIMVMIHGMIITSIVSYYVNSYYSSQLVDYPIGDQLRDMIPYLVMAGLMGGVVYLAGRGMSDPWAALLVQAAVGIVTYAGLCKAFRLAAFAEVWREIGSRSHLIRTRFAA